MESKEIKAADSLSPIVKNRIDDCIAILKSTVDSNRLTDNFFTQLHDAISDQACKSGGHDLSGSSIAAQTRFQAAVKAAYADLYQEEQIPSVIQKLMVEEIEHLNAEREQEKQRFAAQSASGLTYQQRLYLKSRRDIDAEAVNNIDRSKFYDSEALGVLIEDLGLSRSATHGYCFYDGSMANNREGYFNNAAQGKNYLVVFERTREDCGEHWQVKKYEVTHDTVAQEPAEAYDPSGADSACGLRALVKACQWAGVSINGWDVSDDSYRSLRSKADEILLRDAQRQSGFGNRARQLFAKKIKREESAPASDACTSSSRLSDDQKKSIYPRAVFFV